MKRFLFILFIFLIFGLSKPAYADDIDVIDVPEVFDSSKEAVDDLLAKTKNKLFENGKSYQTYQYHIRSDHQLNKEEISASEYTDLSDYISSADDKRDRLFEHTGNPVEGDFLRNNLGCITNPMEISHIIFENGITSFYVKKISYLEWQDEHNTVITSSGIAPTKERFELFKNTINQILDNMHLEGKSDVEKYIAIHNWIAENVSYNIKYTFAENAVLEGKTLCAGYASLFYYMANYAGLDARIIGGATPKADSSIRAHAWNIVCLDGSYYFVDETNNCIPTYRIKNQIFVFGTFALANGYLICKNSYGEYLTKKYHVSPFDYGDAECKHGHAFEIIPDEKEITCTDNHGGYTYRCKNCGLEGRVNDMTYPILSPNVLYTEVKHGNIIETVLEEPGCDTLGKKEYKCEDCGMSYTVSIPKTGHDYQTSVDIENPYCTQTQKTTYTCSKCGDTYTKITKYKTEHDFNEGVVVKQPTTHSVGYKKYTCKNCDYIKTEEIPQLTDDWYGDDIDDVRHYNEKPPADYKARRWVALNDGGYTFFASRYYRQNPSIVETIEGNVTSTVEEEGNCVTKEKIKYTAKYAFEGHNEISTSKIVSNINPNVHQWGTPSFEWSNHYLSCKAKRVCDLSEEHIEEIDLSVTHHYQDGESGKEIVYTASGHFPDGTYAEDRKVFTTNDNYTLSSNIEYEWHEIETGYECIAFRPYMEDPENGDSLYLTVTCQKTPAGCEREGCLSYHAEGSFPDGLQANDTKEIIIPADHHEWDEGSVLKEATCKETGIIHYTCSKCNSVRDEEIPQVKEHQWKKIKTIPSSCSKTGMITYICTICGDEKTEEIEKTEHDWEENETIDKEATCEENGQKSIHCQHCEASKDIQIIPALNHDFTESITQKPTCTEEGEKTFTCKNCHQSYTEKIEKTEHQWSDYRVTQAPTCTANGKKTHTCNVCGKEEEENIPSIQHEGVLVDKKEPSCEENGFSGNIKCKFCSALLSSGNIIPALGHDYKEVINKEATCTEDGEKCLFCQRCNTYKDVQPISAIGHDYNTPVYTWSNDYSSVTAKRICKHNKNHVETETVKTQKKINKEATCLENGSVTYTSNAFSNTHFNIQTKTVSLPVLKIHNTKLENNKNATCTQDGYTGDEICTVCHKIIVKGKTISKTGHKWDAGQITSQPTETSEGTKTYKCQNCNETKTESIPKIIPTVTQPVTEMIAFSAKGKTASVSFVKLKKKNQILAVNKIMTQQKTGKMNLSYTLSFAKKGKKNFKHYFIINKKTGKLIVKKRLKKGVYNIKIKVTAIGSNNIVKKAVLTKVKVK